MSVLGNHKARLVGAVPCFTRSGKRQLEVEFEIVGGDLTGRFVGDFFSAEGKARPFLADNLRSCGWDGSRNLMPSASKNVVEITIYEEEYNGQTKQRIRINRPHTVLKDKQGLISKHEDRLDASQTDAFLDDLAGPRMREPGEDDDLL